MNAPFQLIQVFDAPNLNFRGNISAVVFLENELSDAEFRRIGEDFNQPATTFLWEKEDGVYNVRWFAPDAEIGLCGHGSLAAAAFLSVQKSVRRAELHYSKGKILSEQLRMEEAQIQLLQIPVLRELAIPNKLKEGLGISIDAYFETANKHIVLAKSAEEVRNMKPDFAKLRELETFGYSVTAKGKEVDFVSRTIVPHVKQLEDHATGSSHAALAPFWAKKLSKNSLKAHQLSPRKAFFHCNVDNEQVSLSGHFSVLGKGSLRMS